MAKFLIFALSLFCLALLSCTTAKYISTQAQGQWRILHHRERIATRLKRPDLEAEQRDKLQLVLDVRQFAHQQLGLRQTAAYTYFFDTYGQPLAYNLSAAPKTSLRPKIWHFPLVGPMPYLGFFRREDAKAAQKKLEEQENLDTDFRPISAYSSLGWFADPVYSPLLKEDEGRLVEVIIHETAHNTIFLRGRMGFNESLATFIGDEGARLWLKLRYGEKSARLREFEERIKRSFILSRIVAATCKQLEELYQSPLTQKEKLSRREVIFSAAQQRYREEIPDQRYWGVFVRRPLNNAVLLNYGRYEQGRDFHNQVYQALNKDLARLVALYKEAQKFDDPASYVARRVGLSGFTGTEN